MWFIIIIYVQICASSYYSGVDRDSSYRMLLAQHLHNPRPPSAPLGWPCSSGTAPPSLRSGCWPSSPARGSASGPVSCWWPAADKTKTRWHSRGSKLQLTHAFLLVHTYAMIMMSSVSYCLQMPFCSCALNILFNAFVPTGQETKSSASHSLQMPFCPCAVTLSAYPMIIMSLASVIMGAHFHVCFPANSAPHGLEVEW